VLLVRPPASQHRVRDLMTAEVATVTGQTPVSEVISQLIEHGVKLLVVVDEERRVLGVVTLGHLLTHDNTFRRLDLQRAVTTTHLSQHVDQVFAAERTAGDVMIRHPLVLKDDTSMDAAARWMIAQHVTRMPVVDADEKLIGMLDQAALLQHPRGSFSWPVVPGTIDSRADDASVPLRGNPCNTGDRGSPHHAGPSDQTSGGS